MLIPIIDIQLTKKSDNSLSFTEVFPEKNWSNNVSYIYAVLNERATDFRGFQLSLADNHPISTLDGTHKLFGKYADAFISGVLPSSGDLNREKLIARFKFKVNYGDTLSHLYITYDGTSHVFARCIRVSKLVGGILTPVNFYFDEYKNICILDVSALNLIKDDVIWVDFYDCNDATQTIKITRITDALVEMLFPNSIVSEEYSEHLYDSQLRINPGLITQYADLTLYDRKGILRELALQELLALDVPVHTGTALDTSLGYRYEYDNTYFVEDWDISADSSEINVTCRDKSYIMQNTMLQSVGIEQRTVNDMLSLVFKQIGKSWSYLDDYTKSLCYNVIVPDNWFKEVTLYDALQKICITCLLHVYMLNDTFVVAAIPGLEPD